jgi:hypothetical protein
VSTGKTSAHSEAQTDVRNLIGVMTVDQTKKAAAAAEAAGQTDRARRLRSWLTEVTTGKEKPKGRAAGSYPWG